jgi:hypothetical protein
VRQQDLIEDFQTDLDKIDLRGVIGKSDFALSVLVVEDRTEFAARPRRRRLG